MCVRWLLGCMETGTRTRTGADLCGGACSRAPDWGTARWTGQDSGSLNNGTRTIASYGAWLDIKWLVMIPKPTSRQSANDWSRMSYLTRWLQHNASVGTLAYHAGGELRGAGIQDE